MEEAKFSINIKFNLHGYDSQITARADEQCGVLIEQAMMIIAKLEQLGATGERRWEAVKNGNGKELPALPQPKSDVQQPVGFASRKAPAGVAPVNDLVHPPQGPSAKPEMETIGLVAESASAACPLCGVVGSLQLIGFRRGKVYVQAWKCQDCKRWIKDAP